MPFYGYIWRLNVLSQWAIWWGPDIILLYNDAYSKIAGSKHPALFGQAGKIGQLRSRRPLDCISNAIVSAWGELWEELGPLYDKTLATGQAVALNDGLSENRHCFGDPLDVRYLHRSDVF